MWTFFKKEEKDVPYVKVEIHTEEKFKFDAVVRKTFYSSLGMGTEQWDGWVPCKGSGKYFMKDDKKYYQLLLQEDVVYMVEDDVQFLKQECELF